MADRRQPVGVIQRPGDAVDGAGSERNQVRTDAVQANAVLQVVIDHPFQRGQVPLRQPPQRRFVSVAEQAFFDLCA